MNRRKEIKLLEGVWGEERICVKMVIYTSGGIERGYEKKKEG